MTNPRLSLATWHIYCGHVAEVNNRITHLSLPLIFFSQSDHSDNGNSPVSSLLLCHCHNLIQYYEWQLTLQVHRCSIRINCTIADISGTCPCYLAPIVMFRLSHARGGRNNPLNRKLTLAALTDGVDPDEQARTIRLIRICNACNNFNDFRRQYIPIL